MRNLNLLTAIVIAGIGCGVDVETVSDDNASARVPEVDRVASERSSEARAAYPERWTQVVRWTGFVAAREGEGRTVDPGIVNAWGLAFSGGGGDAWVTGNGANRLSVYKPAGALRASVSIPVSEGRTNAAAVTGMALNEDPAAFGGDTVLFVTEDGMVASWRSEFGSVAKRRVAPAQDAKVYTGLAIAYSHGAALLLCTDLRHGTVDVYDSNYRPVDAPGGFLDLGIPADYGPYNVVAFGGAIVVTYAKRSPDGTKVVPGSGNGYVNVFDPEGTLFQRLLSRGALDAPWGVAIAPEGFGEIAGHLLVGNYGDGRVNVYKVAATMGRFNAVFDGALTDVSRRPIAIEGLRSLTFGRGGGFEASRLYFTAGSAERATGLLGYLSVR